MLHESFTNIYEQTSHRKTGYPYKSFGLNKMEGPISAVPTSLKLESCKIDSTSNVSSKFYMSSETLKQRMLRLLYFYILGGSCGTTQQNQSHKGSSIRFVCKKYYTLSLSYNLDSGSISKGFSFVVYFVGQVKKKLKGLNKNR